MKRSDDVYDGYGAWARALFSDFLFSSVCPLSPEVFLHRDMSASGRPSTLDFDGYRSERVGSVVSAHSDESVDPLGF